MGIDPQKGRTYAALTDSVLVVAAEAEAVSDETGGRIRLKSGCPAWQRRVSRKVEGWESGDGEVSIMVGGFCGRNDTHVEMDDARFKVDRGLWGRHRTQIEICI